MRLRNILLICGILSSLLYVTAEITASVQWDEYSYSSHSVSELLAYDAPTRPAMTAAFIGYNILVIAFASGILMMKEKKNILIITGILILLYAIDGLAGFLIFPSDTRGIEDTVSSSGSMHIYITVAEVLFILLSLGFGAFINGKWFRFYSIATLITVAFFGIWAGMDIPKIIENVPTPYLGIKERVNIYGYMLWVIVFAVVLLKSTTKIQKSPEEKSTRDSKFSIT